MVDDPRRAPMNLSEAAALLAQIDGNTTTQLEATTRKAMEREQELAAFVRDEAAQMTTKVRRASARIFEKVHFSKMHFSKMHFRKMHFRT